MAGSSESKFVSHDGPDAQGVRAEVYVQKGTGQIVSIKPGATNVTAQISVQNDNPKVRFPLMGWVPVNDPIYPLIQEAFDAKASIEYRFESQRKKNEPRETPIMELRETMDKAREHTTPIFAGINGQLSSEAVTNPAEDPAPGGRIRAVDTVTAAPAPAQQQPQQQYQQQSRPANGNVIEEAPYREFNSDGSVNYGSYAVTAAVGAEAFVRRLLAQREPSAETIAHYAIVLLAIADQVQKYVTNKKPTRMAGSHTRIRGIVYDTVENLYPIPDRREDDYEWVAKVGTVSRERFSIIDQIASTDFDFASLKVGAKASQPANPSAPAEPQRQQVETAPAASVETPASTPEPEPVPEQEPAPAEKPAPAQQDAEQGDLSALSILGGSSDKAFEIFPQQDISMLGNEPKVSAETMETFKEWVGENGFDLTAIFKLLKYTFGAGHVASLPEQQFSDFLDFYVGHGEENFSKVLDYAETVSGS